MTVPTLNEDRIGRAIAMTQERLRLPTLSKADARELVGRYSDSSFERFCIHYGIKPAVRGRYRRNDLLRALEKEARGQ